MWMPFLKRTLQVSQGTQSLSQYKRTQDWEYCVSALRELTGQSHTPDYEVPPMLAVDLSILQKGSGESCHQYFREVFRASDHGLALNSRPNTA